MGCTKTLSCGVDIAVIIWAAARETFRISVYRVWSCEISKKHCMASGQKTIRWKCFP